MLRVSSVSKLYGNKKVLDNVSFEVPDGTVTGLVGPNGAGKTTALRIAMGLTHPLSGEVFIDDKPIRALKHTASHVAAMLDQSAFHPKRSVHSTILALAQSQGVGAKRVAEVIDIVGLSEASKMKVGALSLGMCQRLGIASVLLTDPRTMLFDEPVNGLDPEGVRWVRTLCRQLADEGRAVLISSHLLSEVSQTVDRVVVLGRGKVLAADSISNLTGTSKTESVLVSSPDMNSLWNALHGLAVEKAGESLLRVRGANTIEVSKRCLDMRITLNHLSVEQISLEDAFMELTQSAVEYRSELPTQVATATEEK